MPPKRKREVEDPNNTWNQQLMAATLRFDLDEVKSLVEKGADPVNAREPTPFSLGDRLPPLAAVALQGTFTPEALQVICYLMEQGATFNDRMDLPGHEHKTKAAVVEEKKGGMSGGTSHPTTPNSVPQTSARSHTNKTWIPKTPKSVVGTAPEAAVEDVRFTEAPADMRGGAPSSGVAVDQGTVLHYLVGLGDHAHLLQVLLLCGERRSVLPTSVMRDVEMETIPVAKGEEAALPPQPESKRGSRDRTKGRPRSSSRRASRGGLRGKSPEPPLQFWETRGPQSSLPPIESFATPSDICLPDFVRPPASSEKAAGSGCGDGKGAASGDINQALVDFDVVTSITAMTAVDMALRCGDVLAVRLLTFYGASTDFSKPVNGMQTALARACSTGNVVLVEQLLDAGDSLSQLSADGRYTLIHYAAGQPSVLEYLVRRGLCIDTENAYGDSALVSLIRFGTGRNAEYAAKECPRASDAAKLAELPYCAERNYILMPLPPMVGNSVPKSKSVSVRPGKNSTQSSALQPPSEEVHRGLGGRECGTWWSFSALPTADMLQNLVECGANCHGTIPDEELALRYVTYAERVANPNEATVPSPTGIAAQQVTKRSGAWRSSSVARSPQANDSMTEMVNSVASDIFVPSSTSTMVPGRLPLRLTPLMHAIIGYHPEVIRKLVVEYRADISRRDSQGACALHYAALCPHKSVMELLLSPLVVASNPQLDVNALDMAGRTPLHYAAAKGNVGVVEVLLSLGSMTLAGKPDRRGMTPLHVAVRANEVQVVGLLVRHSDSLLGAISSSATMNTNASRRRPRSTRSNHSHSSTGMTSKRQANNALAMMSEHITVDIEAEDAEEHSTALEMAIKLHRDVGIIRILLGEGSAMLHRRSGLNTGGSLLHRAVADKELDYVNVLLEYFSDVEERDTEDRTPLHVAVDDDNPHIFIIRSLLQYGAKPYSQSVVSLTTPLHIAAQRCHAEVLKLLLYEAGGSPAEGAVVGVGTGGFTMGVAAWLRNRREKVRAHQRSSDWLASLEVDEGVQLSDAGGSLKGTRHGETSCKHDEGTPLRCGFEGVADQNESIQRTSPTEAAAAGPPLIAGSSFVLTDSRSRCLLHILCSHTDPGLQANALPFIEALMESDTAEIQCEILDIDGRTAIHEACLTDFAGAVKAIIARDPRAVLHVDGYGRTLLHDCVIGYSRIIGIPTTAAEAEGTAHIEGKPSLDGRPFIRTPLAPGLASVPLSAAHCEGGASKGNSTRLDCVDLLLSTVSRFLPCALRGFPLYPSSLRGDPSMMTQLTITSQLQRQMWCPWGRRRTTQRCDSTGCGGAMDGVRPSHTHPRSLGEVLDQYGGEVGVIRRLEDFINVTDRNGRTPLLLAGELGNIAAAKKLLRTLREIKSDSAIGSMDFSA